MQCACVRAGTGQVVSHRGKIEGGAVEKRRGSQNHLVRDIDLPARI